MIRRLNNDGSRYDVLAAHDRNYSIKTQNNTATMESNNFSSSNKTKSSNRLIRNHSKKNSTIQLLETENLPADHTWLPLTAEYQYDDFRVSIVGDPSRRKHLLPSAIFKTKIKYLFTEVFLDLYQGGRTRLFTFDFYVSYFIFLVALWVIYLVIFTS